MEKPGKHILYVFVIAWSIEKPKKKVNGDRLIDVNPGQKRESSDSEPTSGLRCILWSRVQWNCVCGPSPSQMIAIIKP